MSESHIHDENMTNQERDHSTTSSHSDDHRHHHSEHGHYVDEPRYSREEPHIRHSGHRHRRHRCSGSDSKKGLWSRLKRDKKLARNLLAIAAALFFLTAIVLLTEWYASRTAAPETVSSGGRPTLTSDDSSILLSAPFFDDEVILVNEATLACINADPSSPIERLLAPYREEQGRLDIPRPATLTFDIAGLPSGCSVSSVAVEILEEGGSSPRVFSLEGYKRSLAVPHLKTGTEYRYRINLTLSNGSTTAMEGSFRTADTPRILTIDGIANVRDIGGWKTTDGKTIRQGLLYRGSELDGAVETKFSITETGVHDMLSVLGIRTDMDLRSPADNPYGSDALGNSVEHIYYNAPMYEIAFSAYGKEKLRTVFADLADENNYPVYLHCTYGMDRTGIVCYLLEAFLGLSEEDLMREYQLTLLYYDAIPQDSMDAFIKGLTALPGETMQEKAENYLLSAGVTAEELQQIRTILLA